ncbi:MAG: SRPBCC domain-containing protein [Rhodospirillales bacterium]|nr:SRPBCC domain-containing protein [Rhodospirillales bacterium]
MTRRIATAIDIDAPAAVVWRVLVDFSSYPEWNPFIRRINGEAKVGSRLEVTVQPANRKPMTFRPTVRMAEPDRELRWLGRVLLPGIFDGEHAFIIEPRAGGCRLRHEETFRGILVPAFGAMLDDTAASFASLNSALKQRCEA